MHTIWVKNVTYVAEVLKMLYILQMYGVQL